MFSVNFDIDVASVVTVVLTSALVAVALWPDWIRRRFAPACGRIVELNFYGKEESDGHHYRFHLTVVCRSSSPLKNARVLFRDLQVETDAGKIETVRNQVWRQLYWAPNDGPCRTRTIPRNFDHPIDLGVYYPNGSVNDNKERDSFYITYYPQGGEFARQRVGRGDKTKLKVFLFDENMIKPVAATVTIDMTGGGPRKPNISIFQGEEFKA